MQYQVETDTEDTSTGLPEWGYVVDTETGEILFDGNDHDKLISICSLLNRLSKNEMDELVLAYIRLQMF